MSEMTKELIQQALDQDFNKANATFADIMAVKMSDVLDQEQIKLADQVYNGVEPEDEDVEDDDIEMAADTEDEAEVEIEDESGEDVELDMDDEDDLDDELEWGDEDDEDEDSEES